MCDVAYIFSDSLLKLSNNFTRCTERASRVHSLIFAYNLIDANGKTKTIAPRKSDEEKLKCFHDEDFLRFLIDCTEKDRETSEFLENCELYGLEFECPILDELGEYVLLLAGAAFDAADCLTKGGFKIAVNWFGGWHHCKKDFAAGFCYINDCVLSILQLRKKFERVLYVDLDAHHGDGVQDAFYCTNKVFTLSFHRFTPGLFYPGTGDLNEIGSYKGHNYCLNVPFREGVTSDSFNKVCSAVIGQLMAAFKPQAVVCQCGADGMAYDPVEALNLTSEAYVKVVQLLKSFDVPLLILGGGGYNRSNTARCWASIQAALVDKWPLDEDIPEHEYLDEYGPSYTINVKESKMRDLNTEEYLDSIVQQCTSVISKVQVAEK